MAGLLSALAAGGAQGYATGSAQNMQVGAQMNISQMQADVKGLMEARITERSMDDKAAEYARGRADKQADYQQGRIDKAADETTRVKNEKELINARSNSRGGDQALTKSQQLKNMEIDVARKKTADLSEQDVKLKTSKFTASGRSNPAYDSNLASRLKLAGQRKYGEDATFDAPLDDNNDASAPASATPNDGNNSALDRFATDSSMTGMRPGRETPDGVEVFDSTGRLVGHYR